MKVGTGLQDKVDNIPGTLAARKDTAQRKGLGANKELADTRKGKSTRTEPGGINKQSGMFVRKRRKEFRGIMIRKSTMSKSEKNLLIF